MAATTADGKVAALLAEWSLVFVSCALLLNAVAVAAHLNAWGRHRDCARKREAPEKIGYFVFLVILFANMLYLVRFIQRVEKTVKTLKPRIICLQSSLS